MIKAICKEAELRNDYIQQDIATMYFGGGTPSLCTMFDVRCMVEKMRSLFNVDAHAEITLEANPDDITAERLLAWKEAGINRLSIGVQSFFDEDLQWMNRVHNSSQAYESIILAQHAGFENISIDLIYGTPGLTNDRWQQNVRTAVQLNIQHLSCYALTVEPNTALQKMIELNKKVNVDAEQQSRQFELLMQLMGEAAYEHYEISNFARPGFRSKHNTSYWQGILYLGLGPSAHSFNGNSRQWNISNNALYIESINKNILPCETEELTNIQKLNEYIMISLRTKEGLSLKHTTELNGEIVSSAIAKDAQKFIQQDLLELINDTLILTKKGRLFADGVAADLFRS
jgi:oxygen-independent coproporphyrinogen-3 oxidase